MVLEQVNRHRVILGSKSPRRQELLKRMGVQFTIQVSESNELYTAWSPSLIVEEIARSKMELYDSVDYKDALVVTADTIVYHKEKVLGKPLDPIEAFSMIQHLQGTSHEVYTGVALQFEGGIHLFSECSEVTFSSLADDEIWYYIRNFNSLDKAGGYGIQDWIGMIGIEKINGSYENVMGLPTARLYKELKKLF